MHFLEIQGRRYAQFERLRREAGLVHAFSTRPVDMAPRSGPDGAACKLHRLTMVRDWGLDPDALRTCLQVHEPNVTVIDTPAPGGPLPRTDAAVTSLPGIPLMTFSADCPLVLVFDLVQGIVGMVHASWRCTVARTTQRLVELMQQRFGCTAANLLAGVGPGAGPCCYEVQTDVYEAAAALADRDRLFQTRDERLHFDLWQANRTQLLEAGIAAQNVEVAGVCTLCHNDVFYSYRREGKGCGHFALLAALAEAAPSDVG